MSIIFQLFHADDLQILTPENLLKLKLVIRQQVSSHSEALGPSLSTILEIPPNTPPQLADALRKRVHEVFQQLTGRPPRNPSIPLAPSRSIPEQLFEPDELDALGEQGRTILEWAISCEVADFVRYNTLEAIKDYVYAEFSKFAEIAGQRPKGPDTKYSPFNQSSPLYRLHNW
jgi:hypothetical protein